MKRSRFFVARSFQLAVGRLSPPDDLKNLMAGGEPLQHQIRPSASRPVPNSRLLSRAS